MPFQVQRNENKFASSPATATATLKDSAKYGGIIGIGKILLMLGACIAFLLLNGRSPTSPHTALERMARLQEDLTSLEILKKKYAEDETELRWDKRRIEELEQRSREMRSGFKKTASFFLRRKEALEAGNEEMERAMHDAVQLNAERRDERAREMTRLSEDIARAAGAYNAEHEENVELRRLLGGMRDEIEKSKQLRGGRPRKQSMIEHAGVKGSSGKQRGSMR